MLLLKLKCTHEIRKALIAVDLNTSSPTLSLSDSEDPSTPFKLVIRLGIAETTQPGRAVTSCTSDTVFHPSDPQSGLDTPALNTVGVMVCSSDPQKKIIFGIDKPHRAHGTDALLPDYKSVIGCASLPF